MKPVGQYKERLDEIAAMRTRDLFKALAEDAFCDGDMAREICKRFKKPGAQHRHRIAPSNVCEDYEMPQGCTWLAIARSVAKERPGPKFNIDLCCVCNKPVLAVEEQNDPILGTVEGKKQLSLTRTAMELQAGFELTPSKADRVAVLRNHASNELCAACAFLAGFVARHVSENETAVQQVAQNVGKEGHRMRVPKQRVVKVARSGKQQVSAEVDRG